MVLWKSPHPDIECKASDLTTFPAPLTLADLVPSPGEPHDVAMGL